MDERRIMLKALSRAIAYSLIDWDKRTNHAWDVAKEYNVIVTEADTRSLEILEQYKMDFIANLAKDAMEKRRINDPTELTMEMVSSLAKWKKLLATIDRTDVDQVTDLLNKEIYDKIDVSTYGVN